MADWYVSSTQWTAMAQFAGSHAYIIGDLIRQRGNAATQTITSLTSVTTTATATVTAHGFITGQSVLISGAVQTNYNKQTTITVTDANTFTYSITATTSPATGSPVVFDSVAQLNERAFRCTTAGTSAATEPAWTLTKGLTTTSNTAVFTEVTANSLYNWTAPAARIGMLSTSYVASSDRVFLASDHAENDTGLAYSLSSSNVLLISVSRAGSIPPAASDILNGASITVTINSISNVSIGGIQAYWQGITFTIAGTAGSTMFLGASTNGFTYFKNCAFVFTNTTSGNNFAPSGVLNGGCTWDNCTVQFAAVGQYIAIGNGIFSWINTPSAIQGATIPTSLFNFASSSYGTNYTIQGVDLSALGAGKSLIPAASSAVSQGLRLLDCRLGTGTILSGAIGGLPGSTVELINCDSGGTNYRNEFYQYSSTQTTDIITVRSGGATDGTQAVSWHVLTGSFNTTIFGASQPPIYKWNSSLSSLTATVEILSNIQLNNNDVWLEVQYLGSGSYPLSSFANNWIATPLTASAPVTSSTATWPCVWNVDDSTLITFSNSNLTATKSSTSGGGVRSMFSTSSGLYYFEITDVSTSTTWRCGLANSSFLFGSNTLGSGGTASVGYGPNTGIIAINGSTLATIQTATSGDVIGIAVDFGHSKIWIRKNAGNWNNDVIGNQNPATNTGGASLSTLAAGPYFVAFGDSANGTASATANFGATSFNTAAPSGFSAWNTIQTGQKLQVPFTTAMVGLVRAVVKVGKISATVFIDPLLTIA